MSEDPFVQLPNQQPSPEVYTVIGAGVIGLLTAHELAQQGHEVTIVSQEGKPDENSGHASVISVGQFLPWLPDSHRASTDSIDLEEVVNHGREFFAELAEEPHRTGVLTMPNVELIKSSEPWPAGLPEAMKADEKLLDKPIKFLEPDGSRTMYDTELKFDTFSINAPRTVKYLADRAEAAGVTFQKDDITPEKLNDLRGVVINAAGIGAGDIAGETVNFYKGQTIVVQPLPGDMPKAAISVEDIIMMPREDGTVVIGALYRDNPTDRVPRQDETKEIIERISDLFQQMDGKVDGLKGDFLDRATLIVRRAGYRVESQGGEIRIAQDDEHSKLLHAYGFGGIGWSVGSYFAKKIAGEAQRMHREQFNKET